MLCCRAYGTVRVSGEQSSLFLLFLIFNFLQGDICITDVSFSCWSDEMEGNDRADIWKEISSYYLPEINPSTFP